MTNMNGFEIIVNIIEQVIIFTFIKDYSVLSNKFSKTIFYFYIGCGSIVITLINVFKGLESYYVVLLLAIYLFFSIKYTENSFLENVFVSMLPVVLTAAINEFLIVLFSLIFYGKVDFLLLIKSEFYPFLVLLSKSILFVISIYIAKLRKKYLRIILDSETLYLLVTLGFIKVVTMYVEKIIYGERINDLDDFLIVTMVLLFLIIYIFIFFNVASNKARIEEKKLMKEILIFEKRRYDEIVKLNNQTIKMKHNMKFVLSNVLKNLEQDNNQLARVLLVDYLQDTSHSNRIIYTQSSVIDYFINYYMNIASENNIEFHCEINYVSDLAIDENNLAILLGNLLENAIENCGNNGSINILIHEKNEFIEIAIENSLDKENAIIERSSKKESNHGYGIKSIKEIIDSNNGFIFFETGNYMFMSRVLLPIKIPICIEK